ncbi:hypothetical protein CRYUN_Cryun35bG0067200 [Craigia yunnanensis]
MRGRYGGEEADSPPSTLNRRCVDLPISFVPPVAAQTSGVGENSSGKRCKMKKGVKLDTDTQLAVAGVAFL